MPVTIALATFAVFAIVVLTYVACIDIPRIERRKRQGPLG